MSEHTSDQYATSSNSAEGHEPGVDPPFSGGPAGTPWQHLADADPIRIRDPLAELLGMVPEGEPLVVGFADVVTAAGHACPAVSGAYRATQLALAELYPDDYPLRSEVSVVVDGTPEEPGLGPMANVIRHVTGAADGTGFSGFGEYGGREDLLSFGDVDPPGPGRAFAFRRTDTGDVVRVAFDPSAVGIEASDGGPESGPTEMLPRLIRGTASTAERERFYEAWHGRVQRILRADSGPGSPFSLAVERRASGDGDGD